MRELVAVAISLVGFAAACTPRDAPPISRGTNVLLLTLCTLRADRVGAYGYAGDTTPRIDELASHGVLFRNVLAPAPWTRASVAAMVTGLYPRTLDIEEPRLRRNDRVLGSDYETLAEALSKAGYYTIGITANPNTNAVFNFHQGYDFYRDTGVLWRDGYKETKVSAPALAETLFAALEADPRRPFFAHLVYVDVHLPFRDDVAGPREPEKGGEGHSVRYDRELRFLDAAVGDLVDALRERESIDLLVVVNSDHGEAFGRIRPDDRLHGGDLFDSTIRVPWILSHPSLDRPDRPGPRAIDGLASGVDLVPTLLDLLDVPRDETLEGMSHAERVRAGGGLSPREFDVVETRFIDAHKSAIVTPSHKLIEDRGTPGTVRLELYDLTQGERIDRIRELPTLAQTLHAELRRWQRAHPPRHPAEKTSSLTPAEAKSLGVLGYVE